MKGSASLSSGGAQGGLGGAVLGTGQTLRKRRQGQHGRRTRGCARGRRRPEGRASGGAGNREDAGRRARAAAGRGAGAASLDGVRLSLHRSLRAWRRRPSSEGGQLHPLEFRWRLQGWEVPALRKGLVADKELEESFLCPTPPADSVLRWASSQIIEGETEAQKG